MVCENPVFCALHKIAVSLRKQKRFSQTAVRFFQCLPLCRRIWLDAALLRAASAATDNDSRGRPAASGPSEPTAASLDHTGVDKRLLVTAFILALGFPPTTACRRLSKWGGTT
jgi:hypothetical protein